MTCRAGCARHHLTTQPPSYSSHPLVGRENNHRASFAFALCSGLSAQSSHQRWRAPLATSTRTPLECWVLFVSWRLVLGSALVALFWLWPVAQSRVAISLLPSLFVGESPVRLACQFFAAFRRYFTRKPLLSGCNCISWIVPQSSATWKLSKLNLPNVSEQRSSKWP